MLREIVIDTETTGLDAARGDRLIEIGCVEIINRIPTGREFHHYLNPEREVHPEAVAVHGLSTEFLKDKPLFKDVATAFLAFLGDAALVAHNASLRFGLYQCRTCTIVAFATRRRAHGRYPDAGAAQAPGRSKQPR